MAPSPAPVRMQEGEGSCRLRHTQEAAGSAQQRHQHTREAAAAALLLFQCSSVAAPVLLCWRCCLQARVLLS